MLKGFDEAELLALVEDELDPAEAARLRRRLVADPQALALVEQLREDRARMRTIPEPEVPDNLLVELEPFLARPMLMPLTPARRRRPPLMAMAAAAVVVLTLGGLWAALVVVLGPAPPGSVELAEADTSAPAVPADAAGPALAAQRVAAAEEVWPPRGTVIHHHEPSLAFSGRPALAGEPGRADRAARGGERLHVAADFMLVVTARDETGAERMLQRAVSDLSGEAALVRNFTYREAEELGEALRLAEGARGSDRAGMDEMVAEGLGGVAARHRADRTSPGRPRPGGPPGQGGHGGPRPRPQDQPEAKITTSGLLVGSTELAPSLERQLDFSERGAAYTLCVPAARLTQVLARLQLDEQHQTALRVETGETGDGMTDELRWLRDWPLVRQAATAMDTQGRDVVILLPVVVEKP